jgi:hypothetical protein
LSEEPSLRNQSSEDLVSGGMFFLSLAFLGLLAAVMVLWIDVDRIVETSVHDDALDPDEQLVMEFSLSEEALAKEIKFAATAHRLGRYCALMLALIWPLFVVEQFVRLTGTWIPNSRERISGYWWLFCIVPPLRLCAQQHGLVREQSSDIGPNRVWLPKLGWQDVNRNLQRRLERAFSMPMILIALLILPILGLHFLFKDQIIDYPYLRILLHFGTGLIWFAFAVEFIVMVSVAENKLAYCKKHWLDLAIILLPLVSFLRTLRVLRAGKLVKLGKLQQVSRVIRVYRLRGVAMRALRALMVLEVIHRVFRTKPENRIKKLEQQCREKEHELAELHEEIARIKRSLGQSETEEKGSRTSSAEC